MATHNDFGAKAEKFAKSYLLENNYEILETNYRFGKAEIDIIAKKDDLLIIVEVKARQYNSLKQPFEAVNKKKIVLIHSATDHFINKKGYNLEVRFDIISIYNYNETYSIQHIKDAFEVL